MTLTSKQRAYLKSLAMTQDPIIYLGKSSLTPENTKNVEEALAARELIKIGVQKNCDDDPKEIAETGHRVNMTGLAIKDNSRFEISTVESDREGNSYTYETLGILRRDNIG